MKIDICRNGVKPNNPRVSTAGPTNTKTNGHTVPTTTTQSKSLVTTATRVSLLPPNSANNNRKRPVADRHFTAYRSSQTPLNNIDAKTQPTRSSSSSSIQRNTKESTANGNGLLNNVTNRPLTAPAQSQVAAQRRTVLPHSSTYTAVNRIPSSSSSVDVKSNRQTIIPRSSSSTISQGRKTGIPMGGAQQKSSTTALTR